LLGFFFLYSKT